jgi:integrase/recombinase XerD
MDLQEDSIVTRQEPDHFHPPGRLQPIEGHGSFEEFCTDPPRVFPSRSFIEKTIKEEVSAWAAEGRALEHLIGKFWVEQLPGKKHVEGYLRHQRRRNRCLETIRSTGSTIQFFLRFIKKEGTMRLEQMDRWDLEAFVEHEQDRGVALSTVRTRLGILKGFFRYLIDQGVVDRDVLPWKLDIKVPQALPRAMDPDDVTELLSVIDRKRDRAMILLLLRSGMRIGELLKTTVDDIQIKEQKIFIYQGEKNHLGRVVYFSDDARGALVNWLGSRDPSNDFVFYGHKGRALSYAASRAMFSKYLKKAGLSHKGYTLHCLRHTYATELLNAGMRLECLEKLLGHTSLEMTRRYARLTDKTREEQYFKAMSIIEGGNSHGRDQRDHQLPSILEKTQLLSSHDQELHEHP